jgi:hypothetical protein
MVLAATLGPAMPTITKASRCGIEPNLAKDSKFQRVFPVIYREKRPPLWLTIRSIRSLRTVR